MVSHGTYQPLTNVASVERLFDQKMRRSFVRRIGSNLDRYSPHGPSLYNIGDVTARTDQDHLVGG